MNYLDNALPGVHGLDKMWSCLVYSAYIHTYIYISIYLYMAFKMHTCKNYNCHIRTYNRLEIFMVSLFNCYTKFLQIVFMQLEGEICIEMPHNKFGKHYFNLEHEYCKAS